MTSTGMPKTCPTLSARQKRIWDKAASGYDRQIAFFERNWFSGGREWLGERARGRVLEVAVGTGRSLPHYPADVTVTGIELSPAMLAIARQRATDLGRDVTLREADAEHLPFDDASFDTVTCALALCTIPSPIRVLPVDARRDACRVATGEDGLERNHRTFGIKGFQNEATGMLRATGPPHAALKRWLVSSARR